MWVACSVCGRKSGHMCLGSICGDYVGTERERKLEEKKREKGLKS